MTRVPSGTMTDPVRLLWTGGWDSSFRLLQLMHETQAFVQPIYVLDDTRGSIADEVRAMRRIRTELIARSPAFAERLLPTRHVSLEQIPPDGEVSDQFQRLAGHVRVGLQYRYLGRLARAGDAVLELSVHDREHGLGALAWEHSETVTTAYGEVRRLKADAPDHLDLLRPYAFPVLGRAKREMGEVAKAGGYDTLLELSWFCHRPRARQPCGECRPCQQVIQGRMAHRMPLTRRLLGHVRIWRVIIRDTFVLRASRVRSALR